MEAVPLDEGQGKRFINRLSGDVIPKEFVSAVEIGVMEALQAGILAGYQVDDVELV